MKLTPKQQLAREKKDSVRLGWLLELIRRRGLNGVNELIWTPYNDGDDVRLDRPAIDRAMRDEKRVGKIIITKTKR